MLFYIIVGLVVISFLAEVFLENLNATLRSSSLPGELKGIYNEEKYRESVKYEEIKQRYSLVRGAFGLIIILAMLFLGGFAFLDEFARSITDSMIVITLIFFGIIIIGSDLLNLPFDWYGTFVIEEKFGFNKTTPRTFMIDKLKGWMLTFILGGGLLAMIAWFYYRTTDLFWIYTLALITIFMIFMNFFYSTLIVPLFNRQTRLEDGELRQKIASLSKHTGFRLDDVFVIDGSRRSTKANAYFAGFAGKKRIVLFDTLIEEMPSGNILAVLAHEIGHYKKKHIFLSMAISFLTTAITLFIFSLLVANPALSYALGAGQPSFHIGLVAFGILYTPVSAFFGIAGNWISRRNEFEADRFAAEHHPARDLADALIKLSVRNLSNLRPHPAYVFVHYSHPPLLQRLEALSRGEVHRKNPSILPPQASLSLNSKDSREEPE
jgi:STE24 endopeptidase